MKQTEIDLMQQEASLTDKERFTMFAYILLRKTDKNAASKAYFYSRATEPKANKALLDKKAEEWISSTACQSFIELYQKAALSELDGLMAASTIDKKDDLTANEEIILELENLKDNTTDVDQKIKIIKQIVDVRHKNKDQFKEDTKSTKFYLPIRCKTCLLYLADLEKINGKK